MATQLEPGCYGDGTFGHQHTRERCADLLESAIHLYSTATGEARALQRDVVNALRGDMSDDAGEEYDACELLDTLMPHESAYWGWSDGDFGLWSCDDSEEG